MLLLVKSDQTLGLDALTRRGFGRAITVDHNLVPTLRQVADVVAHWWTSQDKRTKCRTLQSQKRCPCVGSIEEQRVRTRRVEW